MHTMANALFDRGRQAYLAGETDWDTNNMKFVFSDEDTGAIDPTSDNALADINGGTPEATTIATSGNLASKTVTDGVADAADTTVVSVTGADVESINIYDDSTSSPVIDQLLAHLDTGTGIPFTPNGGDVTVVYDSGSDRIFKL